MDCRGLEAMDGEVVSRPCGLDPGNPCRDDAFDVFSTINANIAFFKPYSMGAEDRPEASKNWRSVSVLPPHFVQIITP